MLLVLMHGPVLAADMTIERNQARISATAIVTSEAHAEILRNTLEREFPALEHVSSFEVGRDMPVAWSLYTDLVLQALAHTQSARVSIEHDKMIIIGVTSTPDQWRAALARAGRYQPPQLAVQSEVTELGAAKPLVDICREQFDRATREARIVFSSGSTTLNSNSYASLDRLLELASDCPSAHFHIRGATDSPFGLERARAVASYLSGHGLVSSRISVAVAAGVPLQRIAVAVTL